VLTRKRYDDWFPNGTIPHLPESQLVTWDSASRDFVDRGLVTVSQKLLRSSFLFLPNLTETLSYTETMMSMFSYEFRRHDSQYGNTQQNATQHNELNCDSLHYDTYSSIVSILSVAFLLCWMSLYWMSLCWLSWRPFWTFPSHLTSLFGRVIKVKITFAIFTAKIPKTVL
jgi:hypothetical protein